MTRTNRGQRLKALFVSVFAVIAGMSCGSQGEAQQGLTAEQAAFTERALAFIDEMDALYFERIARLNGTDEVEILEFPTEYADHDVRVARGAVVEKAGRMRIVPKKPKADFQRKRLWSRFFSIDVHPKSPKVGMLHAAFTLHYDPDGTSAIGGWVDVLPGASPPEDLATLKGGFTPMIE